MTSKQATEITTDDASLAQRAMAEVTTRADELLGVAMELVGVPSMTAPFGDEEAVGRRVVEIAAALGLDDVQVFERSAGRPNVMISVKGARPGRRLILCGHLDTQPPGDLDAWSRDPWTPAVSDGRLFGLGAVDMKGSIAAMLFATLAISRRREELAGELVLLLVADEEGGSADGAEFLVRDVGITADAVIIGEPCGVRHEWEMIGVASRGICCFDVHVAGTQGHSSVRDVVDGTNACVKMAELMVHMRDHFRPGPAHPLYPHGATVNVGARVRGGTNWGICPGQASFGVEFQVVPGMTREDAVRYVTQYFAQREAADPRLSVEIEWAEEPWDFVPAQETPVDERVVQVTLEASRLALGRRLPPGGLAGGCDANSFRGVAGIPTVTAAGPGLLVAAHAPDEWVGTGSLVEAGRLFAAASALYLGS